MPIIYCSKCDTPFCGWCDRPYKYVRPHGTECYDCIDYEDESKDEQAEPD